MGSRSPACRVDATVFAENSRAGHREDYGLMLSRSAIRRRHLLARQPVLMPYAVLIAAPPGGRLLTRNGACRSTTIHSMHFRVWSNADHPLNAEELAVLNDRRHSA